MINKIKRLYPNYSIYIRKENIIVDINGKKVGKRIIKKHLPYVLINTNSYEVHLKD